MMRSDSSSLLSLLDLNAEISAQTKKNGSERKTPANYHHVDSYIPWKNNKLEVEREKIMCKYKRVKECDTEITSCSDYPVVIVRINVYIYVLEGAPVNVNGNTRKICRFSLVALAQNALDEHFAFGLD